MSKKDKVIQIQCASYLMPCRGALVRIATLTVLTEAGNVWMRDHDATQPEANEWCKTKLPPHCN